MDAQVYTYDDKIKPIDSIDFSILGNGTVLEMSALGKDTVGIDIPDLYDTMEPKKGGLIDTRLGPSDNHIDCSTCGYNSIHCNGHFGHITLAEPVFHMGYIQFVKKILSCICLKCSKLLIYKNEKEFAEMLKTKSGKSRLNEVRNIAKNVTHCQKLKYGCGTPVSKIKVDIKKSTAIINIVAETNLANLPNEVAGDGFEGKKKIRQILTPADCYDILKNVSDVHCMILGMDPKISRPEDMIHKIFPVPPVQVRPSVKADFMASSTMEDDLTHKLADIVKANIRIRKYKESLSDNSQRYGPDHAQLLQYHIATYYDNETVSLPKAEQRNKVTKSLASRLKGKEGRIRGNLMGKRVDYSARTVITPDPSLDINELGVPKKIAQNITFPEIVTPFNIDKLQQLVKNGRNNYPGANFVFPISSFSTGKRVLPIDLRYREGGVELRFGDVVERHIVNGDIVLLNRQPTLHKLSMMGHRIKVIDNDSLSTFRLNVAVTTPYNADFDGDEMNIFIPQSLQTQIELEEIADVKRQMITPAISVPIIGIVQDGLIGAYNLTKPSMRINWQDAMNIMSYTTIDEFEAFKTKKDFKGTELYSMILPSKINTDRKNFVVKDGILDNEKGILSKAVLGSKKKNNLIHLIWDEYGIEATKDFLDNTQRLINNFNLVNGFTVGIGDIHIPYELEEKMNKLFESKKLEVDHLITEMENNPDLMGSDTFELSVFSELNTVRDTVSKLIMQNLTPENNFNIMILSGSKGGPINMGQMGGCVGQQAVEGKRIKKKVNGRSLVYFHQNDDSAEARGFIERSYINGMKPTEFIFHNMAAREGLIDTAIKSVTGDTPIVIMENGETKRVLIGDWIDAHLKTKSNDVEHHVDRELELLKTKQQIYVPTTDSKGHMTWGEVTALTRHDPGKELYKITTHGGRDVIVSEFKSLLIWNSDNNSFEMKDTPLVKVGDYTPVTHTLPRPPKINNELDLSTVFSKEKYIHGTDFVNAVSMMKNAMEGRDKIPSGWWTENNGKSFTLPYESKARLMRMIGRSRTDNIKENNIYLYGTNRADIQLPNKLILDHELGQFFGLYLAEGNVDESSGYIQITNNDSDIKKFATDWFSKYGISTKESTKINNIGGTTSDVRGYSTLFGKLLVHLMGHGAGTKYVPKEAFSAPHEFITGILDGYFSGDGTVTKNSIQVTSASKELIEGISMLCNMIGVFGKTTVIKMKKNNLETINIKDINMFSIRGQWATKFQKTVNLMLKEKQDKLAKLNPSSSHRNFTEFNDVVLDPIAKIEKIDVKLYPKLYDMTIPSTLNFGLANGLQVVDTAESGYVQRKLIKSMEDVSIKYDSTVRMSNDNVVQYIYGDNGIDTCKQYEYELKSVLMGNNELASVYKFTKDELKKVDWVEKDNDAYYSKMKAVRDHLRFSQRRIILDSKILSANYMLPVNFDRIIANTLNLKTKSNDKLEPKYIVQKLDEIIKYNKTKVTCMKKKDSTDKKSLKYRDEVMAKYAFQYSLHDFLSPKRCIIEYKFNKEQFDHIVDAITAGFNDAIVQPGEMVGTIAAQSIGEPCTQMTLNSIDWLCDIFFKKNNKSSNMAIGKFIDDYVKTRKDLVKYLGDNESNEMGDTYYIDTSNENIQVPSVDEAGKITWNKVTALTKHLPMNSDGTSTLLLIKTRSGREVTATKAKSFLTRKANKLVATRGDEINVGDHIPICQNLSNPNPIDEIDMLEYFPKTEYIHGSEISKAKEWKNLQNSNGKREWFKDYSGKKFVTPYSRQDSLKYVLDGNIDQVYENECIYPKKGKNMVAKFPEKFCLDWNSGFFFGAYLAEGLSTGVYTAISNNDPKFREEIIKFCDKHSFGYHIQEQKDKNQVGWTSTDVRIHSVLLAKFMVNVCNTGSSEKIIPDFAYDANDDFVKGLLNGYYSGDGHVCGKYASISATSVSKNLLVGISLLLTRFGIVSAFKTPTKIENNNRGSKNIKQHYILTIGGGFNKVFAKKIGILTESKMERLDNIDNSRTSLYGRFDIVPNIELSSGLVNSRREDLYKMDLNDEDKEIVNGIMNSDVYYDKIISIEEVEPSHKYVYDLTVENDKTFMLSNGLLQYDTFHHTGIGNKGTASLGVPRVKELLSFSKNLKTPIMEIYLTEKYRKDKDMANKIASYLKYTTIEHLRKRIDVYYDPVPYKKEGFMEKDNVYNIIHSHNPNKYSCQSDIGNLPWLMRIEFDREKMMTKEVTLRDIKTKFCNFWETRHANMKGLKKEERQLIEKIVQCAVISNTDNDLTPIVHLRFDMNDFDFGTIVNFTNIFIDNFKLKGIDSIQDSSGSREERTVRTDNANQELVIDKEYVIYTKGVNMVDIRYINGIDLSRTLCNDVVAVYNTFGVEAARASLLREIKIVLAGADNYVNFQHLSILIDVMTSSGALTSIDRHGLSKTDTSPFSRASFEKTIDQFITAAIFGEKDNMKSVSARIMGGLVIQGGTGACNVMLDTDMIQKSEFVEDIEQKYKKTYTEISKDSVIKDVLNKDDDAGGDIFMPM